jgi:hypothetical protein
MAEVKTWKKLTDKSVTIGDKEIPLRYTVHQMQKLEVALGEKDQGSEDQDENLSIGSRLAVVARQDMDVCEIALNPDPNNPVISREEIENQLDLDQVKILSQYWLSNKVFSPQLVKN